MNALASAPPNEANDVLQEQLRILRDSYAQRLGEKVAQIEVAWRQLSCEGLDAQPSETLIGLHRMVHSLAGSGATFGFPLVSQHARRAELVLKRLMHDGESLSDSNRAEIEAACADLQIAAQMLAPQTLDFGDLSAHEIPVAALESWIYVLCEAPSNAEIAAWAGPFEAFGYRMRVFNGAEALKSAALSRAPAALIIDCQNQPLNVEHDGKPLSATLFELFSPFERTFPIIWTSQQGDLRARLQAVRLGGAAFFTHPVDVDALMVKLDDLTSHQAPDPFRVLIVDDEPALARLLGLMLRQAGMETREVTDPFGVMAPLVDFRPDLILMDVYMPGCSGTELAAVIRQQEAYIGIPIVFLSVETDVVRQLEAMRQGGDDFLIKPVEPRHLISAVSTRATRARILRNLMVRDSLTGLLNHTKTKEQLGIELKRAQRLETPVSLAMIDIDHFKTVNDSYGHATGDRILRSLSRLLVQRLRQTDIVGRYGGEEFAVILSGADADEAAAALDNVRAAFEALLHNVEGREFRVTFSAGIASTSQWGEAASLSEAADRALYEAKHSGRNRIVCAKD